MRIFPADNQNAKVSNAIAALEYIVANDIKVSNNSWVCYPSSQCSASNLDLLYDAIEATQSVGHIFVAAAGNHGADNGGTDPEYPASFDLPNIISVAGIADSTGALWVNSNYGRVSVDLAAPVSNYSTCGDSTYCTKTGTSMATPHVAGVVALTWSNSPSMTWEEVVDLVLRSARRLPKLGGRVSTGGVVDAPGALGDCNLNDVDDYDDIHVYETSDDCNENDLPDECEDCNENGLADSCDIGEETSEDCNDNTFPDECDIEAGASEDCDENEVPDECEQQGTCCEPGVNCTIQTEACCEDVLEGIHLGDFTVKKCVVNPKGACCNSSAGYCVNNTLAECCAAYGGQYGGNGSTCPSACDIYGPQP